MNSWNDNLGRVLVFVAHPDDETVGCSGLLQRAASSIVVFAVDGAPPNYDFERKFRSLQEYSNTRFREASRALGCLPRCDFRRLMRPDGSYFLDQHLFQELPAAFASLMQVVREFSPDVMVTHAYEGGHIDHDASHILAAQAARDLGLATLEFPLYWRSALGRDIFQRFRASESPEVLLRLSQSELERKRQMLAQYATQTKLTSMFRLDLERFRPFAPHEYGRPSWRNYAFENRRWRLKTGIFLERAAEFERWASTSKPCQISSGRAREQSAC